MNSVKKILITGANGLLGQKLIDLYLHQTDKQFLATGVGPCRHPNRCDIAYQELDITQSDQVDHVFKTFQPDCVIHTAAMTNVDACETEKALCDALNVTAVDYIAKACKTYNTHMVHISTDFIFDGSHGPIDEEEIPCPLSYYGESKLKGEKIVKTQVPHWAILRTVLVYGVVSDMSRSNIVLWAKSALEKQQPMKVVDDQFRTPTLAEDLAMGCLLAEHQNAQGVFNISGQDFMSIFELVGRVARFFNLNDTVVTRSSSHTLNQAAKRPPITGFIIDKAKTILGYKPHSFEEGLALVQSQLNQLT